MTSQSDSSSNQPRPDPETVAEENQRLKRLEGDLHEWRSHPVTEAVMRKLARERQGLMDSWAKAHYIQEPLASAEAVGMCSAIAKIIDIKAEDLLL